MAIRFCFVAGNIFLWFCVFSVLHEKLLKGSYGEEKEKFVYVLTLIFIQNFVSLLYAYVMRSVNRISTENPVPTLHNACISFTYMLAMVSSFMALQWVSYPAQVIAKSCKPIPVLVMGVLIGKKVFPPRKYLIVFLIVFGIGLFLYRDDKAAGSSNNSFGVGEVLLIMSLIMDGLTNSLQERVMAQFNPKSETFMIQVNKWALIYIGSIILYTGEIVKFLGFVQKYPFVIYQIVLIALCSSLGQHFIYKCLTEYGTLTCSIITTTRKFFTVLGSIIIFGHVLSLRQWAGVTFVFTGLFLDIYFGKQPKKIVQKQ